MSLRYEIGIPSVNTNVFGKTVEYTINGITSKYNTIAGATIVDLLVNENDSITVKVVENDFSGNPISEVLDISFTAIENSKISGVRLVGVENVVVPEVSAPVAPPTPEPPVENEEPVNVGVVIGDAVVSPNSE